LWCSGGFDVAVGKPEINYLSKCVLRQKYNETTTSLSVIEKLPAAEKSNNSGSGCPHGKHTLGSRIASTEFQSYRISTNIERPPTHVHNKADGETALRLQQLQDAALGCNTPPPTLHSSALSRGESAYT